MEYRLDEIKVPLNYTQPDLYRTVASHTGLHRSLIEDVRILRRSLDARQKPRYNLTLQFCCPEDLCGKNITNLRPVSEVRPDPAFHIRVPAAGTTHRAVVIGAGPAGLTAALILAENGLKPLLFEQGAQAEKRAEEIGSFLQQGTLDLQSNILFGEGGAGLWSDGKLTSRHKNRALMLRFFRILVQCGAPESILIDAEPHLGSDRLMTIIPALRKLILSLGGEIVCSARLTDLALENNRVRGVYINGRLIPADSCILATGHSARDIYSLLAHSGVSLARKPMAMGVRVELPQKTVNRAQYGTHYQNPLAGAAAFRITRKAAGSSRSCYTFCMCPGGEVLPCASSPHALTTNGMSLSRRSGKNANAAFLVPVTDEDYRFFSTGSQDHPELAGLCFQEKIEHEAFLAGGGDYSLPASRLSDFLEGRGSSDLPADCSCKRYRPANICPLLPDYIRETLVRSLPSMLRRFGRLDYGQLTVYGAETRSSSPVRILRDEHTLMSLTCKNLYPCGEGAGYAGGIVSSALDGMTAAASLLNQLSSG